MRLRPGVPQVEWQTLMKALSAAFVVLGLFSYSSAPVAAQSAAGAASSSGDEAPAPVPPAVVTRNEAGRTTVRASRISEPLTLDGQLTEAWYRTVLAIDGFVQQEPRENEPASEKTEAWIFFDDENLYVAARNWDSEPDRMVVNELRHDSSNLIQNENFGVVLDTFHDKRNGFWFLVNAAGGTLE